MGETREAKTKASAAVWISGKCECFLLKRVSFCGFVMCCWCSSKHVCVWGGATHGVQMFNCPLEAPASSRGYALSRWGGCTGQTVSQAEDLIVLYY